MCNDLIEQELEGLETAEEFLDHFEVDYEDRIVHVNRLHILQRFHDYITHKELPEDEPRRQEIYRSLISQAYNDFVSSDAQSEKVFKVFHMHEPQTGFLPLDGLFPSIRVEA